MTKEQVQKHGEVIKWFCDNPEKGVWCQSEEGFPWYLIHTPTFDTHYKYVQNDEYTELRKAKVDGKLQWKWKHFNPATKEKDTEWKQVPYSETFAFHGEYNYRIKPDEPELKVGDWVRDKVNCKIVKLGKHFHEGGIELWTPQEGDVVIFLDEPTPRLIKLQTSNIMYAKSLLVSNKCIPYTGQPFEEMK